MLSLTKTILVSILFLGYSFLSYAQKIDFNNPPWETGCDSASTQTEMNICSYEKYKIADSTLTSFYNILLNNIDSQYQSALKDYSKNPNNITKDYVTQLKDQKNTLAKSKNDFDEMRKSTANIIGLEYKGGSMEPMMVNVYLLDLTINQIKILAKLIDDIINN